MRVFGKSCASSQLYPNMVWVAGSSMINALGAEVDRLEAEVAKLCPGIRHIDLVCPRALRLSGSPALHLVWWQTLRAAKHPWWDAAGSAAYPACQLQVLP